MHIRSLTQTIAILNLLRRSALNSTTCSEMINGMSMTQAVTLGYLRMNHGQNIYQKDLEAQFKLRRSTVSSMLNNLEKKGLILRETVPHDARLKRIALTKEGDSYSQKLQNFWDKLETWMVQCLTPQELSTLESLLQKIEDSLEHEFTASSGFPVMPDI